MEETEEAVALSPLENLLLNYKYLTQDQELLESFGLCDVEELMSIQHFIAWNHIH